MSVCLGNSSATSSPYKMINDEKNQKQGIVTILSSSAADNNTNTNTLNNSISSSFPPPRSSIRRTLSADMSSQKWLNQNGFSPSMKRAQSSEQLHALGEENYETTDSNNIDSDFATEEKKGAFEDIWSNIQAEKKKSWSCILSQQKTDHPGDGPAEPYVHPLMRRTTSSLSEKSLEICTESLGSETGSDGFSYPSSEPEDSDNNHMEQEMEQQEELSFITNDDDSNNNNNSNSNKNNVVVEEIKYVEVQEKYNHSKYSSSVGSNYKKVSPRSAFPPPLPSLAHRDGSNLHMRSHRQDGRLVLEAVAVPSQNCFRAERHDGRLLLTLASDEVVDPGDEDEVVINKMEAVEQEEEEEVIEDDDEEELAIVMDRNKELANVHRSPSAMIMRKLMELTSTRNKSTWPRSFNTTIVKTLDEDEEQQPEDALFQPRMTRLIKTTVGSPTSTATVAASALNAYEYYWRRRSDNDNSLTAEAAAAMAVLKPLAGQHQPRNLGSVVAVGPQVEKSGNNNRLLLGHNGKSVAQQQGMVLVKAAGTGGGGGGLATTTTGEKAEYLVPFLRGCKEPRRSLLFWEPYCIATS